MGDDNRTSMAIQAMQNATPEVMAAIGGYCDGSGIAAGARDPIFANMRASNGKRLSEIAAYDEAFAIATMMMNGAPDSIRGELGHMIRGVTGRRTDA